MGSQQGKHASRESVQFNYGRVQGIHGESARGGVAFPQVLATPRNQVVAAMIAASIATVPAVAFADEPTDGSPVDSGAPIEQPAAEADGDLGATGDDDAVVDDQQEDAVVEEAGGKAAAKDFAGATGEGAAEGEGTTAALAAQDETQSLTAGGELNSGTYQLANDITSGITVNEKQTVTINLNGHKITVSMGDAILNKGILTILGNGEVSTSASGSAAIANVPDATCTVNGGTYSSSKWYVIKNLGTMTIDGDVTVQGTDGNTSSLIDNGWYGNSDKVGSKEYPATANKASLTINAGNFTGKSGDRSCSVLKNDDYGTAVINGGTFDSTNNDGTKSGAATENATTILNFNDMTINGGTFNGLYNITNGSYGATSADKGNLTINGGTFSSTGSDGVFGVATSASDKATTTINGGTFKNEVVGVPPTKDSTGENDITINGGTFANDVVARDAEDGNLTVAAGKTAATRTQDGSTTYLIGNKAISDAAGDAGTITVNRAGSDEQTDITSSEANIVNGTGSPITVNGLTVPPNSDSNTVAAEKAAADKAAADKAAAEKAAADKAAKDKAAKDKATTAKATAAKAEVPPAATADAAASATPKTADDPATGTAAGVLALFGLGAMFASRKKIQAAKHAR